MSRHPLSRISAVLLASVTVVVGTFGIVPVAHAGVFDKVVGAIKFASDPIGYIFANIIAVLSYILFAINYLIALVAGILIAVATYVLEFMLILNSNIINSPIIQVGFSVCLAIANLGLVLGIIIIAIATIVGFDSYGVKQVLWKLVAAAIFVNFSLIFAGAIIQVSDSVTYAMMNAAFGSSQNELGLTPLHNFASSISAAFNPQLSFLGTQAVDEEKGLQKTIDSFGASFGGLLALLPAFILSVCMVLGALAFMVALVAIFAIRYVLLSLLVTVMPIVWVLWIFPFGKSLWNQWWNKFIHYVMYAPLVTFFLYLAMQVSSSLATWNLSGNSNNTAFTSPYSGKGDGALGSAYTSIQSLGGNLLFQASKNGISFALVMGTMLAGLFFANKMGLEFAGTALGAAKSVGNAVKNRAVANAKGVGTRALDRARTSGRQTDAASGETTTRLQRLGSRLNTFQFGGKLKPLNVAIKPLLPAVGGAIAQQGAIDKDKKGDGVDEYIKQQNLEALDAKAILQRLLRAKGAVEQAAITQVASKKGVLGAKSALYKTGSALDSGENNPVYQQVQQSLERFVKNAERSGIDKYILDADPSLARFKELERVNALTGGRKTDAEVVGEAIKGAKDITKVRANIFGEADPNEVGDFTQITDQRSTNIQAVLNLTGGSLTKIANDGTPEQANAIRNTLAQLYKLNADPATRDLLTRPINPTDNGPAGYGLSAATLARIPNLVKNINKSPNFLDIPVITAPTP